MRVSRGGRSSAKTSFCAGVLGFAGGRAVAKLREHPDAVLPILQVSVASGIYIHH